jgi:enoyl-CoA hydratase/carnithine racemase
VNTEQVATTLVASAYCYADSHEHREGIAAFTEKRSPRFIA